MTINTVVFDIGNVLIDWNPYYLYRKFFDNDAAIEAFLQEIDFPSWNIEQDRGRTFEEANSLLIGQFPQWEAPIRAYSERFLESVSGPIWGTVKILEHLRDKTDVRICAITNYSSEMFAITTPAYPFLDTFEGIVVSGDVKMIKPDAEIYEYFYEANNVDPAKAVFIDDRAYNVEGSKATGMDAIQFMNPENLRDELAKRGVPVPDQL